MNETRQISQATEEGERERERERERQRERVRRNLGRAVVDTTSKPKHSMREDQKSEQITKKGTGKK
jgi:hypothetical protein